MSYQTRQAQEYAAAPRTRFNPQAVTLEAGAAAEITAQLPSKAQLGASPTFDLVVGDYRIADQGAAPAIIPMRGVVLTDETGIDLLGDLPTHLYRPDLPFFGSIVVQGLFPRVADAGGAGVDCLRAPNGRLVRVYILSLDDGEHDDYYVSEIPRLDFPYRVASPRFPFPWPTPTLLRRTHLACEYDKAARWYTDPVNPALLSDTAIEITADVPAVDEIGPDVPFVELRVTSVMSEANFQVGVCFDDDGLIPTYFPRQDSGFVDVLQPCVVWRMLPRRAASDDGGNTLIDGTRVWLRNMSPNQAANAVTYQFGVPNLGTR